MAIFEGSVQEFHHYVGPRIRNAINIFAKKERWARNGICEHCNKPDKILDSAHVHGRDRRSIIENILSIHEKNGIVRCDIKTVEREILEGHGVVADTFKFLCKECHVQYDKYEEPALIAPSNMEIAQGSFGIRQIARVTRPLARILRAVLPGPHAAPPSPVPHTQSQPIRKTPLPSEPTPPDFVERESHEGKRDRMVEALARREGCTLIKTRRSLYWNPSHNIRAAFSVSKRFPTDLARYWYGYQSGWERFLNESETGYFVLRCIGIETAFALPKNVLHSLLGSLNTTPPTPKPDDKYYWHIRLREGPSGKFHLCLRGRGLLVPLSEYALPLELK